MNYTTSPLDLKPQSIVSLDTEYDRKDIKSAVLLSVSIGISHDNAVVLKPTKENLMHVKLVLDKAQIIFTQNGAVDYWMLKRHGVDVNYRKFVDCMLLEHLLDENVGHSLGDMAVRYYNDNYKSVFWGKYKTYQEAPEFEAMDYEMRDAIHTRRIGIDLYERIPNKELIDHVHRLYWSLFWTEIEGLKVDVDLMKSTKIDMKSEIDSYLPLLRKDFHEYIDIWELKKWREERAKRKTYKGQIGVVRPEFNFSSDQQLRWLLYDIMECPILAKTKSGSPKTDYDTILLLEKDFPQLSTLAKYKDVKGVYNTFVEGMLDRVEDGRIYPRFNVNGTRNAGRISHSNPNMGNMPKTGVIRNFFIPDDGNRIIGADYSQLEVVIEANLTNDKNLLKIILEGASKHDITAQGLGVTRDTAKTLNFALQYGAGVHKIQKLLGISYGEAQLVFDKYWEIYAGVKSLKDQVSKELADTGRVKTMFGRYRHFSKPENEFEKAKFERQAYNAVIQGAGADCTNRATYLISEKLASEKMGRLWFSVHDEIVCEIEKESVSGGLLYLIEAMTEPNTYLNLKYPLQVKTYGPLTRWEKA